MIKTLLRLFILLFFSQFLMSPLSQASSPLMPVRRDTPRDTMKSYMTAMQDYKKGLETGNRELQGRLKDAIRCLDVGNLPTLLREERARKAAILLKEVIDRVIVIDYDKIPDDSKNPWWRLKDTEIVLNRMGSGPHEGLYLFSQETVDRAEEFFLRVQHLPYLEGSGQGAGYTRPWQEKFIPQWAHERFLGLAEWQWVGLFVALFVGFLLKTLAEFVLRFMQTFTQRLEKQGKTSMRHQILVALEGPVGLVTASAVWFGSIYLLRFEGTALAVLLTTVQIIFSVGLIWGAYRLTDVFTRVIHHFADRTDSELDDQLVPLLSRSLRVFVVVTGALVAIQNLGFNVMSVLAGLGLGGLAFALAAKDTAANLFGSIMILMDRPFKVGEWIILPGAEGTVEEIGFRSTRIRTFYNSVVSIPNAQLANMNIDNMGLRRYRRIKEYLGVTYDTPPEKLEAFVQGIKEIIQQNSYTRKDYYHVVFNGYGDFSLKILVYCFLEVPDWADELREKEKLFLEFLRLASRLGVEYAFPTQTVHVDSFPGSPPLSGHSISTDIKSSSPT